MTENGHDPTGRVIPVARLLAIAPTDDEAEAIAPRGAEWTIRAYANPGQGNIGVDLRAEGSVDSGLSGPDPVQRYIDNVIVWGSPSKVVDDLQRIEEEIDFDHLLAAPLSQATFDLLTNEVMPHFC